MTDTELRTASAPQRVTPAIRPASALLDAVPRVERLSPSLLKVIENGATVGFIEKAGPVFVALAGDRYDRAVEVAQHRELDRAARVVVEARG